MSQEWHPKTGPVIAKMKRVVIVIGNRVLVNFIGCIVIGFVL